MYSPVNHSGATWAVWKCVNYSFFVFVFVFLTRPSAVQRTMQMRFHCFITSSVSPSPHEQQIIRLQTLAFTSAGCSQGRSLPLSNGYLQTVGNGYIYTYLNAMRGFLWPGQALRCGSPFISCAREKEWLRGRFSGIGNQLLQGERVL